MRISCRDAGIVWLPIIIVAGVVVVIIVVGSGLWWQKNCVPEPSPPCDCNATFIREDCGCPMGKECSCEEKINDIEDALNHLDDYLAKQQADRARGECVPQWTEGGTQPQPSPGAGAGTPTPDAGAGNPKAPGGCNGFDGFPGPDFKPYICRDFAEKRCKVVVDSVIIHELDHITFNLEEGQCSGIVTPAKMRYSQNSLCKVVNDGEFEAYEAQRKFLQDVLESLKKDCGKLASYLENNPQLQAQQKEALAMAEERVSSYASSLPD